MSGYGNGYLTVRPSRGRSKARSARTAPGCSSRTPTCRQHGLALEPAESLERVAALRASTAISLRRMRSATVPTAGARRDRARDARRRPVGAPMAHRARAARPYAGVTAVRAPRRDRVDEGTTRSTTRPGSRPSSAPSAPSASRIRFSGRCWDAGVVVTNGTDAPVEDVVPIPSFYGMVARVAKGGRVFVLSQR